MPAHRTEGLKPRSPNHTNSIFTEHANSSRDGAETLEPADPFTNTLSSKFGQQHISVNSVSIPNNYDPYNMVSYVITPNVPATSPGGGSQSRNENVNQRDAAYEVIKDG